MVHRFVVDLVADLVVEIDHKSHKIVVAVDHNIVDTIDNKLVVVLV